MRVSFNCSNPFLTPPKPAKRFFSHPIHYLWFEEYTKFMFCFVIPFLPLAFFPLAPWSSCCFEFFLGSRSFPCPIFSVFALWFLHLQEWSRLGRGGPGAYTCQLALFSLCFSSFFLWVVLGLFFPSQVCCEFWLLSWPFAKVQLDVWDCCQTCVAANTNALNRHIPEPTRETSCMTLHGCGILCLLYMHRIPTHECLVNKSHMSPALLGMLVALEPACPCLRVVVLFH